MASNMASNWPLCGVCETSDLSNPSVVWCMVCTEGLCTECDVRHKTSTDTNAHQTIPMDKYRDLPIKLLSQSQTCPKHSEQISSYCCLHECMCCLKCMIESHDKCDALKPIDEVVSGIKTSHVFRECEEALSEINENISLIIRNREQNSSSLKKERKRIESEIRETKRKVIDHLDHLEAELIKELVTLEVTQNAKIQVLVSTLDKLEKETTEMVNDLLAIKEHASEVQTFMAIKNIERVSSVKRKAMSELASVDNISDYHLAVKLDKTLQDFDKSIPCIGRVTIESNPCNIVLRAKKDKQAQLQLPRFRSIDNKELNLIWSTDVNRKCLYGCSFLTDGRYAVTSDQEYQECILLMREDGILHFVKTMLSYNVFDVVQIPSTDTLAVTTGGSDEKRIILIDLNSQTTNRSVLSRTFNFGITYKDGHLFYSAMGVGICRMNIDDKTVAIIRSIPDMSWYSYIVSYQDKLYYTNSDADTVACCSIDGTSIWEFVDESVLRGPRGLCIDLQGNVYVVGSHTDNLVVLSSDGSRHSELLSKKDGLHSPMAIDFDELNNRLLVVNSKNAVFLYKIN